MTQRSSMESLTLRYQLKFSIIIFIINCPDFSFPTILVLSVSNHGRLTIQIIQFKIPNDLAIPQPEVS